MSLTFLCTKCRIWLDRNQSEMPASCKKNYDLAVTEYQTGSINPALSAAGASFEVAEMIVRSNRFDEEYAYRCLVKTSELLVKLLEVLDRNSDSTLIKRRTNNLISELNDQFETQTISNHLAPPATTTLSSSRVLH